MFALMLQLVYFGVGQINSVRAISMNFMGKLTEFMSFPWSSMNSHKKPWTTHGFTVTVQLVYCGVN